MFLMDHLLVKHSIVRRKGTSISVSSMISSIGAYQQTTDMSATDVDLATGAKCIFS